MEGVSRGGARQVGNLPRNRGGRMQHLCNKFVFDFWDGSCLRTPCRGVPAAFRAVAQRGVESQRAPAWRGAAPPQPRHAGGGRLARASAGESNDSDLRQDERNVGLIQGRKGEAPLAEEVQRGPDVPSPCGRTSSSARTHRRPGRRRRPSAEGSPRRPSP